MGWFRFSLKRRLRTFLREYRLRPPRWSLPLDEREMRERLTFLGNHDVVIDLGAHKGIFTVEAASVASHVYAFEPHPTLFKLLVENTKRYQNITLFNAAASSHDGTATFHMDSKDDGLSEGSTLKEDKSNLVDPTTVEVRVMDFGGFVSSLDCDVSLIKMDIEGAEYDVITSLIDHDVIPKLGRVMVEDHCNLFESLKEDKKRVLKKLRSMGQLDKFDFDWH